MIINTYNTHKFSHNLKRDVMQTQAIIDQTVTMTDVVALQTGSELTGEFSYDSPYDEKDNYLTRIKDHVELLATIVNRQHLKDNFSQDTNGAWTTKPGCENNVTRLLMHEFSLYTHSPLSMAEFDTLCDQIKQLAAQLSENLYLLASSVAVIDSKRNALHNYAIHIQCGKNPQVDRIAKIHPSDKDPNYPRTTLNFFAEGQKTNVVKCKTIGRAEFSTIVEICMDHYEGEGKKSFYRNIKEMKKVNPHAVMPKQISQVVTSESISFYPQQAIAKQIVRVDPRPDFKEHFSRTKKMPIKLSANLIENIPERFKKEYCWTALECKDTEIYVNNPPFGPNTVMQTFPSYPLEVFDMNAKKMMDELEAKIENIHPDSVVISDGAKMTQNLSLAKELALTELDKMLMKATDEASILQIIQEWKNKKLKDVSAYPIIKMKDSENLSLYSIACMHRTGFFGKTSSQKIVDKYVKSLTAVVTPTTNSINI